VEIFIGAFMHDSVIRPYGGDFLVVILLYCLVRSFWDLPILPAAVGVLLFSYLVEAGQYFGLADRLGFKGNSLVRILLGSYFTWTDIMAYTLGILSVLGLERGIRGNWWGDRGRQDMRGKRDAREAPTSKSIIS
jgi:hypothetical protein